MRHSQRMHGLSHVYASAEGEVLAYLVETLESLLNTGRILFGTAEWLTGERTPAESEMAPHAEPPQTHHEWHGVQQGLLASPREGGEPSLPVVFVPSAHHFREYA